MWGGDATFHNIDLNVDALNEEFSSLFVFTSGYIRDLTIHVPWTKLMSEPVTISVNTIGRILRMQESLGVIISVKNYIFLKKFFDDQIMV